MLKALGFVLCSQPPGKEGLFHVLSLQDSVLEAVTSFASLSQEQQHPFWVPLRTGGRGGNFSPSQQMRESPLISLS